MCILPIAMFYSCPSLLYALRVFGYHKSVTYEPSSSVYHPFFRWWMFESPGMETRWLWIVRRESSVGHSCLITIVQRTQARWRHKSSSAPPRICSRVTMKTGTGKLEQTRAKRLRIEGQGRYANGGSDQRRGQITCCSDYVIDHA